jgi:hypothetical protein
MRGRIPLDILKEPVMCSAVVAASDSLDKGGDKSVYRTCLAYISKGLHDMDKDGTTFNHLSHDEFMQAVAMTIVHCRNADRPMSVMESVVDT